MSITQRMILWSEFDTHQAILVDNSQSSNQKLRRSRGNPVNSTSFAWWAEMYRMHSGQKKKKKKNQPERCKIFFSLLKGVYGKKNCLIVIGKKLFANPGPLTFFFDHCRVHSTPLIPTRYVCSANKSCRACTEYTLPCSMGLVVYVKRFRVT